MEIIMALEYLSTCGKGELKRLEGITDIHRLETYIRHLNRIVTQLGFERERILKQDNKVKPEQENDLLTTEEVMERLNIRSKQTLYNLKKSGKLIPVVMNSGLGKSERGINLYHREEVERLVKKNPLR